jgi:hypothetical protein
MKKPLLIMGSLVLMAYGCIKTEPVSPVPHITFKSFHLYQAVDSLQNLNLYGDLSFGFIDGDADIGMYYLQDSNTWNENNYNVYLKPFQKIDTSYYAIPDDSTKPPLYFIIAHDPKLDRVEQNKTINGTITISIKYEIIPPYDTIRYNFYIRDRANNKSNVESTSDIGFKGITLPNHL